MKLLVIGNGMVGHKLLEELSGTPNLDITVLCEEPRPAYDRVHLSAYFAGTSADQLSLVRPGFFEAAQAPVLKLNARATGIDRVAKTVTVSTGETLGYDKLVLATGSYPFVPPLPGKERDGCFVYRTIEDLEAMSACGKQSKVGVVIGGGLLGLECAKALRDLGLQTHVVEFAPRLMAVQVDDGGGRLLRKKIEQLGVTVHTQKNTLEIIDGETTRHRMKFADGTHLDTDMIVFSAGIRPRDELAKLSGLKMGERGGIAIDNACRTSDEDIYAIGECALWGGKIFGLVAPGYEMARVVAAQLQSVIPAKAGIQSQTADATSRLDSGLRRNDDAKESCEAIEFRGADMSTKLKLMGVDVASVGDAHGATVGSLSSLFVDERKGIYKKLVTCADSKKVLGAVLVGDAEEYGTLLQMMLNGIEIKGEASQLILPASDGKPKGLGADALPDAAQICSCNNVSKGVICAAVKDGATSIGAIKTCTKAGSSCGGCVPLATQVMKAEMKKLGLAVNNHLCEHFAYSRQELYHLVRIGKIKTFDALVAKHGKGSGINLGCDICKPVAASILASCWNEFVLKKPHAGLQDSNDHFLANIQKDGSYSIVPRIAGGEITADKLIVIGEVAKKYGLYTKITGGQRIDLFGARIEQLPPIWRELSDAGFESGHAYGKSLRTVKSCVGSTWCRYGVQDSVKMALALEHRYKGLRSPHKLKFGVSGCTRECAEAQSKDVGVIATEKGWNLYVCGNGGMKPRHAELLVGDLDDATLIQYVDRFLMFYVRTADRLQRTSTWRDNLEGGLDYLKDVIVKDSLGLGAELEAEMATVIGTYECEWKKAINDPETLKRFQPFLNSEAPDENLVMVQERGQIRPATVIERKAHLKGIPVVVEAA